ncbi:hypothetical protein [Maricaulis sp.]|uniref:hypothetical protein n=1 Tax=Maricaulis sp. TaxID=1486257 RepID=UPI003A95B05A
MTEGGAGDEFPPEAIKAFWSEVVSHLCAIILAIGVTTLAMRLFPGFAFSLVGPIALIAAVLMLSLPVFRHFSRKRFDLPADRTHWLFRMGCARSVTVEMAEALPDWKVFGGGFYGPGFGRAVGFHASWIGSAIIVLILTPVFSLPPFLLIAGLAFVTIAMILSSLSHNSLPRRQETFSRMESGRKSPRRP